MRQPQARYAISSKNGPDHHIARLGKSILELLCGQVVDPTKSRDVFLAISPRRVVGRHMANDNIVAAVAQLFEQRFQVGKILEQAERHEEIVSPRQMVDADIVGNCLRRLRDEIKPVVSKIHAPTVQRVDQFAIATSYVSNG